MLPDQVAVAQRGLVSGVLGMFLAPCALGAVCAALFVVAVDLPDRDNTAKDVGVLNIAGASPRPGGPGR